MSFNQILDKYRKISFSEKDKGDRFERIMQAYLQTDPQNSTQFKKVWLWNEFPGRQDLGGGDTGIDLVALTHNNEYWAIQCKCYQTSTIIDKPPSTVFYLLQAGVLWAKTIKQQCLRSDFGFPLQINGVLMHLKTLKTKILKLVESSCTICLKQELIGRNSNKVLTARKASG